MQRLPRVELELPRVPRLSVGLGRLALLSLFVVAMAMIRPRLTHWSAGWLVLGGGLCVVCALLVFLVATRRVAVQLPLLEHPATIAVLVLLRRLGLPLLGLAFFLFWTFVYVAIWWIHPHDAFRGLDPHPRFADFFYTSVSTAFVSPPGDIVARSRGARAATMIEMLTAFALVTAYASSFVDWRRPPEADLGSSATGE